MYLELDNVSKILSGNRVLDHITLSFEEGKIYGLSGKNGSGKTMLLRAICGLIHPTEGTVTINGKVLGKDISFPPDVGVLIETPQFLPYHSGFKNLQMLASIRKTADDQRLHELLCRLGLGEEENKIFRKYSLGMKQKLGLAAALMENPKLILLDEPINALDEKSVVIVKDLLLEYKNNGALIIISCHDREELEFLSDEIIYMENGRIIQRG